MAQKVDNFEDRIPGCLSVISLSDKERERLLDYLNVKYPRCYADYFFSVFGDERFLAILDIFEGLTIKMPSRSNLVDLINYIKIYTFLETRNFTPEAYKQASLLFGKRVNSLSRIVAKVEREMNIHREGSVPFEVNEEDDEI